MKMMIIFYQPLLSRFRNYRRFKTLDYDAAKGFIEEMFVKQKNEVESSKLYRGETEKETKFIGP